MTAENVNNVSEGEEPEEIDENRPLIPQNWGPGG